MRSRLVAAAILIPDDEDYCPDFPGHPLTNGC